MSAIGDDRLAWIGQRVTLTLNISGEVFEEFLAAEENGDRLLRYCSKSSKAGAIVVFSCDSWTEDIEVEEEVPPDPSQESEGTGAAETEFVAPNSTEESPPGNIDESTAGEVEERRRVVRRTETVHRTRLLAAYDRSAVEPQDRVAAFFVRSQDGDIPQRGVMTPSQYSLLMTNSFEFMVMACDLLYGMACTMHSIYLPVIERGPSELSGLPELDDSLKHELTSNISKFEQQLRLTTSSRGDRKLNMPSINITSPEQTSEDYEAVVQIEAAVRDWTTAMQAAVEHEHHKVAKHGSPLGEIEFWRERATSLSTIYEQLTTPKAQQMVQVLRLMENQNLVLFQFHFSELSKLYLEAKDNVKFLSTLERHFKHIEKGTFNTSILPAIKPGCLNFHLL